MTFGPESCSKGGSEPLLLFIGVRKTSQLGVSDSAAASTQAEGPRFIAQPKITMRAAATSTTTTEQLYFIHLYGTNMLIHAAWLIYIVQNSIYISAITSFLFVSYIIDMTI